MGYYRCITNKTTQIEFDSSYTIMANNNGIIEYPLKGYCGYGFYNTYYTTPTTACNGNSLIIGNNVYNCSHTFFNRRSNIQEIIIPNSIIDCDSMFYGFSSSYTLKPTISNNAINCSNMFYSCRSFNFNKPVIIPNNVTNCSHMFEYSDINQPIIIGNNVIDCNYMFLYCVNFASTIKIYNSIINCYDMLLRTNNSLIKNVYCTNLDTIKNVYSGLTWTPIVNGAYNAATNIYLYTNLT